MGARRKSNLVKGFLGTGRADRAPKRDLARRLSRAVPPPAHLSDLAREEWRQLMPAVIAVGTVSACDLRAFALLAETLALEAEGREVLKREGITVSTGAGGTKPHAAVRVVESARRDAARLLESFGLTPRGRQSVDVLPEGPARDLYFDSPLLGGTAVRSEYF